MHIYNASYNTQKVSINGSLLQAHPQKTRRSLQGSGRVRHRRQTMSRRDIQMHVSSVARLFWLLLRLLRISKSLSARPLHMRTHSAAAAAAAAAALTSIKWTFVWQPVWTTRRVNGNELICKFPTAAAGRNRDVGFRAFGLIETIESSVSPRFVPASVFAPLVSSYRYLRLSLSPSGTASSLLAWPRPSLRCLPSDWFRPLSVWRVAPYQLPSS